MYIYVKFLLKNLNPGPYPSHPTKTYTYKVTIMLRVRGGYLIYNVDCLMNVQMYELNVLKMSHSTKIYTCKVTIMPKVRDDYLIFNVDCLMNVQMYELNVLKMVNIFISPWKG